MHIRLRAIGNNLMANFIDRKDPAELESLLAASNEGSVFIFKHSVTCPISMDIYREVSKLDADVNLVIVQNARPLSNKIAEKTGIRHESPQAIILKNSKAAYSASHYDIEAEEIEKRMR